MAAFNNVGKERNACYFMQFYYKQKVLRQWIIWSPDDVWSHITWRRWTCLTVRLRTTILNWWSKISPRSSHDCQILRTGASMKTKEDANRGGQKRIGRADNKETRRYKEGVKKRNCTRMFDHKYKCEHWFLIKTNLCKALIWHYSLLFTVDVFFVLKFGGVSLFRYFQ